MHRHTVRALFQIRGHGQCTNKANIQSFGALCLLPGNNLGARFRGLDYVSAYACFYDTSMLVSFAHLWATIRGISLPVTYSLLGKACFEYCMSPCSSTLAYMLLYARFYDPLLATICVCDVTPGAVWKACSCSEVSRGEGSSLQATINGV
jgi:hypothetical protein